eukprot:CAMPEP_0176458672 /NCGR_PEP_ID=MMETSP0127-20121128/32753_1 /TAXON_ID=938130 /ORGANISM="Platyophrya macrostoma, Strain WH" /LENGTH=428 /DNA_ID=CAMNT_0017849327 /DNA_START=23 /DNA_END=1309 /DNA_ORIENTATION=+
MTDEISDWVFECVLQFLKSPLWTVPVQGFIEQNCHEFAADEDENKLVYTELHVKFRELIDELLSSFLEQLGVRPEAFVEAVKSNRSNPNADELSHVVLEFLFALDDFPSFRALMEKKNLELELEAMYEHAKYTQAASQLSADELDEMSDEERFLLEMAIQLSLNDQDVGLKRAEKEDAELLQALALSVAMEQERLLYEQLAEQQQQQPSPSDTVTSTEAAAKVMEALQQEIHERRVANVERALFASSQSSVTSPPSTETTAAVEAQKLLDKALAPIGGAKRGGVFGARGPALPSISSASSGAPPVSIPAQPDFQSLKQEVEKKRSALGTNETDGGQPSKEELEQRAAYFKAQREKILQQKQAARMQELETYKQQQQSTSDSTAPAPPPSTSTPHQQQNESDATREMRLALARRFREDLLQESKKSSAS